MSGQGQYGTRSRTVHWTPAKSQKFPASAPAAGQLAPAADGETGATKTDKLDPVRGMRWRAAVALGLALVSGCSLIVARRPPRSVGPGEPDCSTSRSAPVIDTILLIASVLYAVSDKGRYERTVPFLGLGLATAFGFSTEAGYDNVGDCVRLKDAFARKYRPPRSRRRADASPPPSATTAPAQQ